MSLVFNLIKSILFGIVEGITEWLPISSTAHLLLLDSIVKLDVLPDFFNMFKVVIQLGAILAVLVLYFHKLNPFSKRKTPKQKKDTFSLWGKVLVASVPAAVVGLMLNDIIDSVFSKWFVFATALIVYGILFIWMENRDKTPAIHNFSEMDYKTALLIGVFQMLALVPGTSRSGSTILGAVLLGTSRYIAAEFSFFMAIPVMVGASGLKLVKFGFHYTGEELAILLAGFIVSFIVSVMIIRFLMSYIKKHDFKAFGYYRIVLGAVVILAGLLHFIQ